MAASHFSAMAPKKKARKANEATVAPDSDPPNSEISLLNVLPLILNINDGGLFDFVSKQFLRVTCKSAREMVDPYLTKVNLHFTQLPLFRRSSWALTARQLTCKDVLIRGDFRRLASVKLPHLENIHIEVTCGALDLLPRRNWPTLKNLRLNVFWNVENRQPLKFRAFSQANWPLEELRLEIAVDDSSMTDFDDEMEMLLDPDVKSASWLLKSFPQLRSLEIFNCMSAADMDAFAAVHHERLERVTLSFFDAGERNVDTTTALAAAKWPRLQELRINYLGHICEDAAEAFAEASWFKQLRSLVLSHCSLCPSGATALISGLQGGAIETLELESTSSSALVPLKSGMFPKLKTLNVRLQSASPGEDGPVTPNDVFAMIFSADLPSLETLALVYSTYIPGYPHNFLYSRHAWDVAPVVARGTDVLPKLTSLRLSGMCIKPDCSRFLATILLQRGCAIDLNGCSVHSGLDFSALEKMLDEYHLSRSELDSELRELGLMNNVYWYNLVSMPQLKLIAASVFLENITRELKDVEEPTKGALEVVAAAGVAGDERLRKRFEDACSAIRALTSVIPPPSSDGASGSGSGTRSAKKN